MKLLLEHLFSLTLYCINKKIELNRISSDIFLQTNNKLTLTLRGWEISDSLVSKKIAHAAHLLKDNKICYVRIFSY